MTRVIKYLRYAHAAFAISILCGWMLIWSPLFALLMWYTPKEYWTALCYLAGALWEAYTTPPYEVIDDPL